MPNPPDNWAQHPTSPDYWWNSATKEVILATGLVERFGWKIHPTNPAFYYRGKDVILKEELLKTRIVHDARMNAAQSLRENLVADQKEKAEAKQAKADKKAANKKEKVDIIFPPFGWQPHPTAPGHYWSTVSREVFTEDALYGRIRSNGIYVRTDAEIEKLRQAIIKLLRDDSLPVTVRQVFYQMVVKGLVPKIDKGAGNGYGYTQRELLSLRRSKIIPYSRIVDSSRTMFSAYDSGTTRSPDKYLKDQLKGIGDFSHIAIGYEIPYWHKKDERVQVWLEKAALQEIIRPICSEYRVPLYVARGFSSETFVNEGAEEIALNPGEMKWVHVLHLGDRDPSGDKAAKDIGNKITAMVKELNPDILVDFKQIAVTDEQIETLKLPTRPTKVGNNPHYDASWDGKGSVELDAIPSKILQEILTSELDKFLTPKDFEERKEKEDEAQQWMLPFLEQITVEVPEIFPPYEWKPNPTESGSYRHEETDEVLTEEQLRQKLAEKPKDEEELD
ncbi:hypothetical protein RB623_06840 [Mesorhizobium sp. LHD-90]|uniref:hypothetical protein n=1 Tax=Mesorhizobium sp. LHD-90 TaxID=3071414 RepID=UPI0027E0B143|nr:hypothetical protein [Mesorhizobium sp. LHD-90]MDQ6433767.1 hypothetical protein [Mesorhizobium sp. LHD-90]